MMFVDQYRILTRENLNSLANRLVFSWLKIFSWIRIITARAMKWYLLSYFCKIAHLNRSRKTVCFWTYCTAHCQPAHFVPTYWVLLRQTLRVMQNLAPVHRNSTSPQYISGLVNVKHCVQIPNYIDARAAVLKFFFLWSCFDCGQNMTLIWNYKVQKLIVLSVSNDTMSNDRTVSL